MLHIHKHTFNAFQENTFIISDETGECAIIDPGCYTQAEREQLVQTIAANQLKPVKLLNTHCHIDHIPGNKFVCDTYQLLPEFHQLEFSVMQQALNYQSFFNMIIEPSPDPILYLKDGDEVKFGNTVLTVLFTPGHSPGSLSFYNAESKVIISGDVLFAGGVGRFDLPGASGKVLLESITQKLLTLPDDVKVYSGHGPETTIGKERRTNPYLQPGEFFE